MVKVLKGRQIAAQALGILQRELMFPSLVWTATRDDFALSAGDKMTIRVPARTVARRRPLRGSRQTPGYGTGIIQMDDLSETFVDVTLDEDVYNAVPITDEEMTLDISDFGAQITAPQARAVAEGLEDKLVEKVLAAPYAATLTLNQTDPYDTMVDATTFLNRNNVPRTDRVAVVGPDMEGIFLKSDHLSHVDQSGSDSALRDATIGRLAGFGQIYVCNGLPPNFGVAFHKTAFVMGTVAPLVPAGVTAGGTIAQDGIGMRWIRDYDFGNVRDRSLLDCYSGANWVADPVGPNDQQVLTITGSPSGGSFKLTHRGAQTAAIPYNASANAVASALQALSTVDSNAVSVSGAGGGPYTISFSSQRSSVPPLTVDASGLTGGTNPTATIISTDPNDAARRFVRAVKITL